MVTSLQPHVQRNPKATAIVDDTGRTTWAKLDDRANRWIWALRGLGITAGDRVAVMAGNRRELWPLFVACLHAGYVVVPVNWALDLADATYVLSHSGARALVVEERTRSVAMQAVPKELTVRLTLDGPAGSDGFVAARELLREVPPIEPHGQIAGGPMFYTSGTTGRPKGVMSAGVAGGGGDVSGVAETAQAVAGGTGFPAGGVAMIVGPNYHSGQFVFATFALLSGQTLVVRRAPDPRDILRWIQAYGVTNLLLLTADFGQLLALPTPEREAFDPSSLAVVLHGGAPVPPDVKQRMIEWWGPRLVEYYGATEAGLFSLATTEDWHSRPGTVGRVLPFLECRIVDAEGKEVPVGQEGVLYFRHRGGNTFHYHDDPERTAAAHLEPGLFTVGDVGWLDDDGYLYVSGREAHLVTVGDQRVHPNRVEGALSSHPAVADVGAFGVTSPDGTQELHVAVVLAEDARAEDQLQAALQLHVARSLPEAAVPSHIHVVQQIPRSAAGKILRDELVRLTAPLTT
ncbi:MAG: AMP-binding protein [Euzebya sp.]